MIDRFCLMVRATLVLLTVLGAAPAGAQILPEPSTSSDVSSPPDLQAIYGRIDQLEEEVHQLRDKSSATQGAPLADPAKKPDSAPAKDSGYVIGSDLSAKPEFRNGLFLWIATPNNDFYNAHWRMGAARQRLVGSGSGFESAAGCKAGTCTRRRLRCGSRRHRRIIGWRVFPP